MPNTQEPATAQKWYEGWTDATYPMFNDMTGWPGQDPTSFKKISAIHEGDVAQVTILHFSAHSGTHMDAPNHFMAQGIDISRAPVDVGIGPVRIAAIDCETHVTLADLQAYEARTRPLEAGERLILRTPNSDKKFWLQEPFDRNYHAVLPEAAQYIADKKLLMIGVDYISVGPFHEGNPQTHRALMSAGVWIIESVDLRNVTEGDYEMICVPLKLAGSDATPIRVLLKPARTS